MSDDDFDNDFEDVDFENEDAGFDDFNSSGSLGDAWRNNPMIKIGAVLAVFAVIVGAVILFGGGGSSESPSQIRAAPAAQNSGAQDTVVSQVYREEIEKLNEEKIEQAIEQQRSALPVTTDPVLDRIAPVVDDEEPQEDPLERWRELQEQRRQARAQTTPRPQTAPTPQEPEVDTRAQAVTALSQAMSSQMESILGDREIQAMTIEEITSVQYIEDLVEAQEEKRREREEEEAERRGGNDDGLPAVILQPSGEIEFAQLITEANSDTPGPILAEIASGPLQGSRLIGNFQVQNNFLTLSFDQIVIDGVSYTADAVAIDPSSAGLGVVTEVDQRWFTRVVLPAAAEFLEGFAGAVAQDANQTVVITDTATTTTQNDLDLGQELASGGEELAREVGRELDQIANQTQPLVRVAPGTAIGILFVEPVLDEE